MRRRPAPVALLAGALAGTLATGAAWAGGPSARLLYSRSESAAACPPEAALRTAVASRFGYDPFFPYAPQAVVVQLGRDHAQYTARVELVDAQGIGRGTRSIASAKATCAELFEATALAISIALDASVATAAPGADASDADVATPAAGSAPSDPPAPPSDASKASPRAAPVDPPATPDALVSRDRPPASRRGPLAGLHAFVGLDVLGSAGLEPSLAAGAEVFAGARLRFVSLALGLRADAPASSSAVAGGGRVQSWLLAGTVAPCVHLSVAFGCALAVVGALQARGLDVALPESHAATFVAAGGRLGVDLPFSERWAFRAEGDVLADLRPVTLALDERQVWRAPRIGGDVGAGLVARF